jgi:hypothetical protein
LQSFDDAKLNTRRSLANLLNAVGAMKWKVAGEIYSCDLGLGHYVAVGKSEEIWSLKATLSAQALAHAQKTAGKAINADAAAVNGLKAKLKADFEAAEANRFQWRPLP